MASTWSALKIELLETGANSGTWGTATNVNLGDAILGEAITGQATVDFATDADVTITLTDSATTQAARNLRLNITESSSGVGSVRNLILGSGCQIEKFYLINNTGTGAKTVKNTSGTGISVPAGKATLVYNNGTNVVDAASYFSSLTLGSALPVASGGTGQTTYTDGQLLIGNTTGNTLTKATLTAGSNITITNGSGAITIAATGGSAAGSTTQLQYNNAGAFAGSANMTFDGTSLTLPNDAFIGGYRVGAGVGGNNTVFTPTSASTIITGTSFQNVAFGVYALTSQTATGYTNNTALGWAALRYNTTGVNNCATGFSALTSNTTANNNSAFGTYALTGNTTGASNSAFGFQALEANTTAARNTAVGYIAGQSNTTGHITAVGSYALTTNTTGTANVAVGGNDESIAAALQSNSTGSYNTAMGVGALQANTTASNNTAVGYSSLYSNTTGGSNTAIGHNALPTITTSSSCTAIGASALNSGTAEENTAIGQNASYELTTGYHQTAVGFSSGRTVTTGIGGTYIGRSALASGTNPSYEIVVGSNSTGKGGSTGFINPGAGGVYQGNNSTTWSTTSDRRLKKNIVDNNVGLSVINSIRVRNFEYRVEDEITELPTHAVIRKSGVQLGVIAQELQAVLPECVKTESTGVMSVDADNLTWYMINAIKELKAEVDSLKSQLNQGA